MNRQFFLIFSIAAATLVTVTTHAQAIDKVMYRVTYKTKVVNDTTRRDSLGQYVYRDDDMRLDIGRDVSAFYSGRKAAYRQFFLDQLTRGGAIDLRQFTGAKPNVDWTLYRNWPKGETSFLETAYMNDYRISEKTVTPQWTIGTDTLTLLGYPCTKAETDFKGRHWEAWFAVDIPLDNGPWKLIGLPGLILKAEDAQRQFVFEASGLEQTNGAEDIELVENYKKYEPVTQQQFDRINRTTSRADTFFRDGKMVVKTVDASGHELSEAEVRQQYGKPSPYNPIEIVP